MRNALATIALSASLLLLAGCASQDAGQGADPAPAPSADGQETKTESGFGFDHITSCDDVESVVASYIAELVPSEGNTVDEWGVSCTWEPAEGNLDPANIRTVSVQLAPVEAGAEAPDPRLIAQMDGGEVLENSWVDSNQGVAYALNLGTAVAGTTVTTVWLPGVEATIGGGQWDGFPALDSAAAVDVVKSLVG